MLRWRRCWDDAARISGLRTWQVYAAQHRWDRLVEQEATWQRRQRVLEQNMHTLSLWAGDRRTSKRAKLRARLHSQMASYRCVLGLWRLSVELQAKRRHSAEAVCVSHVRWCRRQGLAALRRHVVQRRQRRAHMLRAFAFGQTQLLHAGIHCWRAHIKALHLKRARLLQAFTFLLCSLGRVAFSEWRLFAQEERLVRKWQGHARRAAFRVWQIWLESRLSLRQHTAWARRRLSLLGAVHHWTGWRRSNQKRSIMRLRACTFCNAACLRAALLAWTLRHTADCLQHNWLALGAALRQWRRVVRLHQRRRYAMRRAFELAATHYNVRLMVVFLRWWGQIAAYATANLEAAARLVHERRRTREFQLRLRRRTSGPTEEERILMEAIFFHWHIHHAQRMHTLQRLAQESMSRHHALLLMTVDTWVDLALPPNRSETLRRRRHVRFSLDHVGPSRRLGSSPARDQGRSSPQGKTSSSARSISAGGVGQWAHKTKVWEASSAFMDCIEPELDLRRPTAPTTPGMLARTASAGARSADGAFYALDPGEADISGLYGAADTGSTVSPAAMDTTPRWRRPSSPAAGSGSPAASPRLFGRQRILEEVVGLSSRSQGLFDGGFETGQPQRYHVGQWPQSGAMQSMAREDVAPPVPRQARERLLSASRGPDGLAAAASEEGTPVKVGTRSGSISRLSPFAAAQAMAQSGSSPEHGTPARDMKKNNDILRFFKGKGCAGA